MAIFISQGRYTREAIQGMTANPEDRSKAVGKLVKAAGGRLLSYYLTFGEYDFLLVAEAPNESAMASAVLAAASGGGVTDLRTTLAMTPADAMKAFEAAGGLAQSFKSAGQAGLALRGEGDQAANAARKTRGGRVTPDR
jgi:uncharacterized protein with GYD domain